MRGCDIDNVINNEWGTSLQSDVSRMASTRPPFYFPIRPASVTANIFGTADAFSRRAAANFSPLPQFESIMLRDLSKPRTGPSMTPPRRLNNED
jgi:hypothetical protein